jgi:hypothetical protein
MLVLGLVLAAGCTSPADTLPQGKALAWDELEGCASTQASERNEVVQSQDELDALWASSCSGAGPGVPQLVGSGQGEAPRVDFARHTVLAVFWGQKSTGGYSTEVVNITEASDHIAVRVARDSPGPACAVAQVVTYPAYLATTEKLAKAVHFAFVDRTVPC